MGEAKLGIELGDIYQGEIPQECSDLVAANQNKPQIHPDFDDLMKSGAILH